MTLKKFFYSLAFRPIALSTSEVDADHVQYLYNFKIRLLSPLFWVFFMKEVVSISFSIVFSSILHAVRSYFFENKKYGGRFCLSDSPLRVVLYKGEKLSFKSIHKANNRRSENEQTV